MSAACVPMIRVLSLGAGVQSTAVLLMSLHGDLEPFDHVIFADTGWEPKNVYDHLKRLEVECAQHGQTITVVSAGSIRQDHTDPKGTRGIVQKSATPANVGKGYASIPFHLTLNGSEDPGILRRSCTSTYKIEPVEAEMRRILGLKKGQRWPTSHVIDLSMGISLDEAQRMRTARRPAIHHVYPLIDMRMDRRNCLFWLERAGWLGVPRSACIGCPLHVNVEWRRMRDEDPESWNDAVEFDRTIRDRQAQGLTTILGIPFLHYSRTPLEEAIIDLPAGPPTLFDTMFGDSCEGFCGT